MCICPPIDNDPTHAAAEKALELLLEKNNLLLRQDPLYSGRVVFWYDTGSKRLGPLDPSRISSNPRYVNVSRDVIEIIQQIAKERGIKVVTVANTGGVQLSISQD